MVIPLCCTAQSTAMWVWINILLQRKINGTWMWFDVTPNNYDTIRFDPDYMYSMYTYRYQHGHGVANRNHVRFAVAAFAPVPGAEEAPSSKSAHFWTFYLHILHILYMYVIYIYTVYSYNYVYIYIVIKRTQTWQPCTSSKGWIRQTQYPQDGITCQPSVDK